MMRTRVRLAAAAIVASASLAGGSTGAAAQDRLPPVAADRLTDAQRQAIDAYRAARGTEVSGPFIPLLRSPELMTRTRALGDYLRYKSALPPRLSEFVILITASHWHQQFEWDTHYPIAVAAGVPAETARAIADGRRPAAMTDQEAALYDLVTELQTSQRVSDATWASAVARFGETGVTDAIGIVGYYTMLAMVLNAAQTPRLDQRQPTLPPPRR